MSSHAQSNSTRTLDLHDLSRIVVVDDVAIAPDGDLVAVTVRVADRAANRYRTHVQLLPVDGRPARPLSTDAYNDHAPRWSPDGARLAFLSDRSGSEQVWLDTLDGDGEARQLTHFPAGVTGEPVWSPDGRSLVVVVSAQVGPEPAPPTSLDHATPPFAITRTTYRVDGQGYLASRYKHLWVVDVQSGNGYPLGQELCDDSAPAWSPDGEYIAFVSNREDARLIDFRSAIWVVPFRGGGAIRVTPSLGVALAPAWSPDGEEIAYVGLLPDQSYGANHQVLLAQARVQEGSESMPRVLTTEFAGHAGGGLFSDTWSAGRAPVHLYWSPDGTAVRFLAEDRARVHIREAGRDGRITTVAGGDRACGMLSVSRDGKMVAFAASSLLHPPDVYVTGPDGQDERCLSALNPWLDEVTLARPEALRVTSADGTAIDAWLIPPAGATEPTPGPLVLDIHGGPHSSFGHVFFFDMQLLAAHGYAVLFANPRATRGYGDSFALRNIGRWGEGDAPDLLGALDAAVTTGWVDPARVGVMGLSYGGYMTNWLIGHTGRFRAAVSENSISNLLSFCGTSDIGWYFTPDELGAEPDDAPELYTRLSPLTAAGAIDTPLLLLNCLEDWRCPIEQAEQLYTALKRRGRTVEMVCFPGESHTMLSIGRPLSRLERRAHLLRWFATYLRGDDLDR